MQRYYKFNLEEFVSNKICDEYLNYKIKTSSLLQKEIVREVDIPNATFVRAKQVGFSNNPRVYDKLIKYFKIKNKNKYLEILEEELNTLFTFIYYNDDAKQQESYERLVKIYEETKGSVLEILTVALMSIAMNTMLYAKDLSILSENTSLLEHFMLN